MIRFSTSKLLQGVSNKEVKEHVEKTLNNISKENAPKNLQSETVKRDLYQNLTTLLKELSTHKKSPMQVLNTLNQPQYAKPMQQVAKQLNIILDTLKSEKSLSKHAPALEKILLDIKKVDSNSIQKGLSQSGVNFEAKLAKPTLISTLPPPLKEPLTTLKALLKTLDTTLSNDSFKAQIETLLSSKKVDKSFMETLLRIQNQAKALLLQQANSHTKESLSPQLQKELSSLVLKLETLSQALTPQVAKSDIKSLLLQVQKNFEPLLQNQSKEPPALQRVQNLLEAPKADRAFIRELQALVQQVKGTSLQKGMDIKLMEQVVKLEELAQRSSLLESKQNNANTALPKEAEILKTQIKQNLQTFLGELKTPKGVFTGLSSSEREALMQLVQTTLNKPDFFPLQQSSQTLSQNSLSLQIDRMVNIMKSLMASQSVFKGDANTQKAMIEPFVQSTKVALKAEDVLKELVNTKQLLPEQKLTSQASVKEILNSDIKGVLLSLKGELGDPKTHTSKQLLLQVDRALAQVEYHQLVSLSSGSFHSYLPMLWEGLKEGSVSLKKLKGRRFFCEINLTLKEYGNVDLMMMLFEDIHVNISLFASKDFLNIVQSNIRLLRQGLNSLGLIPANIHYFDAKEDKHKKEEARAFVHDMQIGSGFNLKV